jgi:hypothetical protein
MTVTQGEFPRIFSAAAANPIFSNPEGAIR